MRQRYMVTLAAMPILIQDAPTTVLVYTPRSLYCSYTIKHMLTVFQTLKCIALIFGIKMPFIKRQEILF